MASRQSSGSQSEELLAVIIGNGSKAVKYGEDNLLLGKNKPRSQRPRKVPGHPLSVVNMGKIKIKNTDRDTESCISQNENCVFLLVIKLPGRWHRSKINNRVQKAEIILDYIQRLFGETAPARTIILFTRGKKPITNFEQNPDLQKLLKKCSGEPHICYKRMNNRHEISELVNKINAIAQRNNRLYTVKTDETPQASVEQDKSSMRNQEEHEEDGNLKEKNLNNKLKGDLITQVLNKKEIKEKEGSMEEMESKQHFQWDGEQYKARQSEKQLFSKEKTEHHSRKISATERGDETCGEMLGSGNIQEQEQCTVPLNEEKLPQREEFGNSQDRNKTLTVKSAEELFQRLGLEEFYPNQLSTEAVLSVEKPKQTFQSEGNVAFDYLQKLMLLNYRARFVTKEKENSDIIFSSISRQKYDSKEHVDSDSLFGYMKDDANSYSNHIHPMDVQMAVFHCADSFLKQNMVTKLSSCQYALPLLVPSPTSTDIELPLWTFRQIKKTWKSVGGLSTSLPVCQVKAPMVFFCRLGSVSTSKSQLLNSVINPKHDTFFHRDSPGSSRNHLFMEGLVEISWYCPAGNTDDLFSECIAFCNLHGDAVEHRKQTDFLAERATVNVVLMENMKPDNEARKLLEKLYDDSSKYLICVISDLQKCPLKMENGNNIKIGLRDRNQAELHEELRSVISTCLQKCNSAPTFSLEESSELAKRCGFRVDEDSEDCQEGKTGALEITELLKGEDISQIKTKFLPCQGKLWQDWSRKNKQLYRLYGDVEQTKSKIQQEMKSIRNLQRKTSLHLMNIVCKHLNYKQSAKKKYFVRWLEVHLDNLFSKNHSEVTQQYYKQLSDVHSLKQKRVMTDDFRKKQEELERLSEKVDAVSCGLEHIFREMGQIYEAWAERPDKMTAEVSALPALAADLLISGHPLELMDGDAAHVPLTWIESVLDKVTETLGDQRVFVLSVLGLQSSGKSTMLNAMFGLQFAVSAGRCTRGAFMQLVRVKEEDKEELKFDYLLVVDTEGLQSLELSGKSRINHDNELATFVIGLGNMTLINIFGENPAEIQEVLQVAVEAVLRMNEVRLNPSCMFVHQNVTDITAAEKNKQGNRRLLEKLDEVAKTEGYDLKCFTDLIKFNIQTDVHYFAQLWEGNPPMAPPNPRYSENVEGLKRAVLRAAAEKKCLRLSELKVRIRDLWSAVLNEDFVFSFKNSLEIAAYRRLEVRYGNWTQPS